MLITDSAAPSYRELRPLRPMRSATFRATRYEAVAALQRALEGQSVSGEPSDELAPMQALYITGHSFGRRHGGAHGDHVGHRPRVHATRRKLQAVYTFGQPMIGSTQLARACAGHKFLAQNVIRYVYRR